MNGPTLTDWIAAGSSLVSVVLVAIGLFFAKNQIGIWKDETRHKRRAESAEDLLAAAYSAVDVMDGIRSPISSIPKEEINNKGYVYIQKSNRLGERGSIFENLRHAQVRAKAVLQNKEVDAAADRLFEARKDFFIALEMAMSYIDPGAHGLDAEDAALLKDAKSKIYGRYDEKDELHQLMHGALDDLDKQLGPIIRIES
jgi:hypothetical protein